MRRILTGLALAILGLMGVGVFAFWRDMRRAGARLEGHSETVRWGGEILEYATGGAGPPVLVVHGSGGGFDQGVLIAEAVLNDQVRWVAPSRFGYLRSTLPPAATFDDQADAFAALLDALEIDRVGVIALSHGGPSALLFALRHPDRVASLILVSAGVASADDLEQAKADRQGAALTWIYGKDWRFWLAMRVFRKRFLEILGADPKQLAELLPADRDLAQRLLDFMNPVSRRSAGVMLDHRAALPGERIAAIRAPTLIIHARDDTLQLFRNARFAEEHIAGARLAAFDRGGHLLMAVEREAIRKLIVDHLLAGAGQAGSAPPPTAG